MSSFKISKIEIIIKEEGGDAEEELNEGPKEMPMFDQTMSLLEMIKEKKVCTHPPYILFKIIKSILEMIFLPTSKTYFSS